MVKWSARIVVGVALVLSACGDDTTAPVGSGVLAVELRAPNDSLFLGRTMQMVAVAIGDSAVVTRPTITWTSSDTLAVVVNSNGLATAVGTGTAVITAAVADQQAQFAVRAMPMRVAPDGMLATAAPAHAHKVCALTPQGHPACLVEPTAPDTIPRFELMPDAINHAFVQFATGFDAHCGLKADGSVWCTGNTGDYLFATRAFSRAVPPEFTINRFEPVRTSNRFSEMTLGGHIHVCGIGRDDGIPRCWGHLHSGVLGRPTTDPNADSLVMPVVAVPRLRALSANQSITCGLDDAGRAVCWGSSAQASRFGMRMLVDSAAYPAGSTYGWHARIRDDAPPFVEVKADDLFACGLTAAGAAHCWGSNGEGQLGIGSNAASTAVERVESTTPFRTLQTLANFQSQICALSTTDDLYCWGQIGPVPLRNAIGARRYAPMRLIRGIPLQGMMLTLNRRCAVTRAGGAVCW